MKSKQKIYKHKHPISVSQQVPNAFHDKLTTFFSATVGLLLTTVSVVDEEGLSSVGGGGAGYDGGGYDFLAFGVDTVVGVGGATVGVNGTTCAGGEEGGGGGGDVDEGGGREGGGGGGGEGEAVNSRGGGGKDCGTFWILGVSTDGEVGGVSLSVWAYIITYIHVHLHNMMYRERDKTRT